MSDVAPVAPVVESVIAPVAVEPVVAQVAEPVAVVPVVEAPVAVKKTRKPKAKVEAEPVKAKVTRTKKRGRGRPEKFVGDVKKGIVALLRKHKNATHVRDILGATGRQKALVALRAEVGLVEKVEISFPKLLKMAEAARITLKKGRPVVAA